MRRDNGAPAEAAPGTDKQLEMKTMLEIKNLHATVVGKPILKGLDLTVRAGEVHAIMGPNGSGKSTLASVLAGRDEYEVTEGEIRYAGQDLLELVHRPPDHRERQQWFPTIEADLHPVSR